jgi:hypothetical protein
MTSMVTSRPVTTEHVLSMLAVPAPRLDSASVRRLTAQAPALSIVSVKDRVADIADALAQTTT